jgi:hypothetical protein
MQATVVRAFMRNEVEYRPGQTFECDEAEFAKWAHLGFIAPYETKAPQQVKKKPKPSAASQPAPASPRPTWMLWLARLMR